MPAPAARLVFALVHGDSPNGINDRTIHATANAVPALCVSSPKITHPVIRYETLHKYFPRCLILLLPAGVK
jgi:hypothetical protein